MIGVSMCIRLKVELIECCLYVLLSCGENEGWKYAFKASNRMGVSMLGERKRFNMDLLRPT